MIIDNHKKRKNNNERVYKMSRERLDLLVCYFENQYDALLRTGKYIGKEEQVREILKGYIQDNFKDLTIGNIITEKGEIAVKNQSLMNWINANKKNIITPSGSVYIPEEEEKSLLSDYIIVRLKERSQIKKEGFKLRAQGKEDLANLKNFAQGNKKIRVNTLPGSYNSPYNAQYDKGNYNAITSLARSLIKNATTCIENTIGGNFHLTCDNDVVNYIITHLKQFDKHNEVLEIINKYNFKLPTKEDVIEHFTKQVRNYSFFDKLTKSTSIINNMSKEELIYIYYVNNLYYLFWKNTHFFLPFLKDLFDFKNIDTSSIPHNFTEFHNTFDEDILILVSINIGDKLILKDPKTNKDRVYSIIELSTVNTELYKEIIHIYNHVENKLNELMSIYNILIDTKTQIDNINTKHLMRRNTVPGSDTDSCIYSCHNWVTLYTGEEVKITQGLYEISSLVIFLVAKTMFKTLYKYSIAHGSSEKESHRMVMKNEFLMPLYIGFNVKKHYASLITMVEGMVLLKNKYDIKGIQLRSSVFPDKTSDFIDYFLKKIMTDVAEGTISAREFINIALERELDINKSIDEGTTDYIKSVSIKNEEDYKNHLSSNWLYSDLWNSLFADKFGELNIPTKTKVIPLNDIDEGYLNWLAENHNKFFKKLEKYIDDLWNQVHPNKQPKTRKAKYKIFPSKLALSLQYDIIPDIIKPLVDRRQIIYENMSTIYMILESLKIEATMDKNKNKKKVTLLMDQYVN
jgi:hypothetical protein